MCNREFLEDNTRKKEHNHYNGKCRGAACQSCNTKEEKQSNVFPVFFHNGSRYDFHFIVEELMKRPPPPQKKKKKIRVL